MPSLLMVSVTPPRCFTITIQQKRQLSTSSTDFVPSPLEPKVVGESFSVPRNYPARLAWRAFA